MLNMSMSMSLQQESKNADTEAVDLSGGSESSGRNGRDSDSGGRGREDRMAGESVHQGHTHNGHTHSHSGGDRPHHHDATGDVVRSPPPWSLSFSPFSFAFPIFKP